MGTRSIGSFLASEGVTVSVLGIWAIGMLLIANFHGVQWGDPAHDARLYNPNDTLAMMALSGLALNGAATTALLAYNARHRLQGRARNQLLLVAVCIVIVVVPLCLGIKTARFLAPSKALSVGFASLSLMMPVLVPVFAAVDPNQAQTRESHPVAQQA